MSPFRQARVLAALVTSPLLRSGAWAQEAALKKSGHRVTAGTEITEPPGQSSA